MYENIKDRNDLLKAEKEDKTEHLTAYHTTDVDFDTFKPGYRGVIWTEKNLDFAKSRMADMGSDGIFTCDVTMKNPKHITYNSGENWDIDSTIRKARNEGYDGVVIDFKLADDVINNSLFQFVLTRNLEADARDILYSIVKANASDALENETLKDFVNRVKANDYITHSYVAVFKPEQVKIINKTLINGQPEISSAEQERETDLKNASEKAFQNHETFYIKHTEENFENYRIAYDDKENHYNIIADRIYPIAKIRESNIIEENLAADIDVDSVIKTAPFEELGFAKVDHHRGIRQGTGEVIYGVGKTAEQIGEICKSLIKSGQKNVLITRLDKEKAAAVKAFVDVSYYESGNIGIAGDIPEPDTKGTIVVATGGTSDIYAAEEAALTAEFLGNRVERLYDVGVAGIHRLLAHRSEIMQVKVIIAVAGMEGALASVIGGLADCPVIAVPTSVGYGAAFGGLAALLSMLNSCASGVSVVNIDNGFGAGYLASMINHIGK